MEKFINKLAENKMPRRSTVTSINKFMGYKSGLTDGINLMKGWGRFYEENKFRLYLSEPSTEEDILEMYLANPSSQTE